jgi:hypothetical protein
MKFLKQDHRLDSSILISQIEKEIKVGIIKPINPKQLLIDIFANRFSKFAQKHTNF